MRQPINRSVGFYIALARAFSYAALTFFQSRTVQKFFNHSSLPHTPYPALIQACSCTEIQNKGYKTSPIFNMSTFLWGTLRPSCEGSSSPHTDDGIRLKSEDVRVLVCISRVPTRLVGSGDTEPEMPDVGEEGGTPAGACPDIGAVEASCGFALPGSLYGSSGRMGLPRSHCARPSPRRRPLLFAM